MATLWAEMVQTEFACQVSREKEHALPVSHFMDATSQNAKVKMELGFINFIVAPIWTALAQLLPEVAPCLENIDLNRSTWEAMSDDSFTTTTHHPPKQELPARTVVEDVRDGGVVQDLA